MMTLRFTLRQLEYLVAVAGRGLVALVAGRANVHSPSVSAAIAQLEAGFGPLPFIRLDLPCSDACFLAHFSDAGLPPRTAERTRDQGVMRAMVAGGFGYSIANLRRSSDRAPDGQRLAQMPIGGRAWPIRLGLMQPPGLPRRTVQEFLGQAPEQCHRGASARADRGAW